MVARERRGERSSALSQESERQRTKASHLCHGKRPPTTRRGTSSKGGSSGTSTEAGCAHARTESRWRSPSGPVSTCLTIPETWSIRDITPETDTPEVCICDSAFVKSVHMGELPVSVENHDELCG